MERANDLVMYVLYYDTSDFPGEWVVRKWYLTAYGQTPDPNIFMRTKTVNEVRDEMFQMGLVFLSRMQGDDPKIVGTFL